MKVPLDIECPLFSSLKNVSSFELHRCGLRQIQIDALGALENLCFLHVGGCRLVERLSGLSCLKNLRELKLDWCWKLIEIQGLEEIHMLKRLTIIGCVSMRSVPDIANKKTCHLYVEDCLWLHFFDGPYIQNLDKEEYDEEIVCRWV